MNENTYTLDLNDKVVIHNARYERLLDIETRVEVLKNYLWNNSSISTRDICIILGFNVVEDNENE